MSARATRLALAFSSPKVRVPCSLTMAGRSGVRAAHQANTMPSAIAWSRPAVSNWASITT